MAIDIFLKLVDGSGHVIPGEATAQGHAGEIEISSWSWGLVKAGTQPAGGTTSPRLQIQDLKVTKSLDRSSTALFLACAGGQRLKSATLTLTKPGGQSTFDYMIVGLRDVLVTSYEDEDRDVSAGRGDETLVLSAGSISVQYRFVSADGKTPPAKWQTTSWLPIAQAGLS